jgi:hypothetical protein
MFCYNKREITRGFTRGKNNMDRGLQSDQEQLHERQNYKNAIDKQHLGTKLAE